MPQVETRILVITSICYAVLIFLVILLSEAQGQVQQTRPSCPLFIYAGTNPKPLRSGGWVWDKDPCKGFGPQTNSKKNSRRKMRCRNMAYQVSQHTNNTDCKGKIVHGQCAQFRSQGTVGQFDAQCFALVKYSNGVYGFKLLVDCADGLTYDLWGNLH